MAIADIIERIEGDAQAEAEAILSAARARAEAIEAQARAEAEREAARIRARGFERARIQAEMLVANARLAARDALLAAKREMAERVLDEARRHLEDLPADEYAAFIARQVSKAALPGQRALIAAADRGRLAGLGSLLSKAGVDVAVDGETPDLPHGVLLEGEGVRVEVSAAACVAEAHDALLLLAVRSLFGEEE